MGNVWGDEAGDDAASGGSTAEHAIYNQFDGPILARSATFDERRMERQNSFTAMLKDTHPDFIPLSKKAQTFNNIRDSNVHSSRNMYELYNVEDVLFRRHFNATPIKPALSFVGDDKKGSITRGYAQEGPDIQAMLRAAIEKDSNTQPAVVVVDPFSTGAILAKTAGSMEVLGRKVQVIIVNSVDNEELMAMLPDGIIIDQVSIGMVMHVGEKPIEDTITELENFPVTILAVLAGAETGVELADRLSEAMGFRTNGSLQSDARRNKYVMGETVRESGTRAVEQKKATKWAEIEEFLKRWQPAGALDGTGKEDATFRPVVVKPMESAGSDDVFLCDSLEAVKAGFGTIMGKINGLGQVNEGVLVQEFLDGLEYVVDSVSKNGEHKVACVWEYDKRAVNDANFVYFGMRCVSPEEPVFHEVVDYQAKVLDALGIKNGPGHAEIKMCASGPCLVEVGSRCHGGEGTWRVVAKQCVGYTQDELDVAAYLDDAAWSAYPSRPTTLKKCGREIFLVSYQDGTISSLAPCEKALKKLKSYQSMQMHAAVGNPLRKTIDCFTRPGSAQIVHESAALVEKEYNLVRQLELEGKLWTLKETEKKGLFSKRKSQEQIQKQKLLPNAVIVVDPFTTGAWVAKGVHDRGYRCICVYSDKLEAIEALTSLVPEGVELHFDEVVGNDPEAPFSGIVDHLNSLPYNIVAILPGAETGVALSDALSEALRVRTNGTELSAARRNKYLMGEAVRDAGVRAVMQLKATAWEEIEKFLNEEWDPLPDPFKAVVKPVESAGSDDVFLCESKEDVKKAFERINGKVNGLGCKNEAVLVQEFLDGTEYVVDSVSVDGECKVTAVWEYDKRAVNGANFVYFGMRLVGPEESVFKSLIEYQVQVLKALQIVNGPGHAEIKMCADGPCLVEVGSRCHGGEGTWMTVAERCVGYTQVDATLDAYLNSEEFMTKYPSHPEKLNATGKEVFLVSKFEGTLKALPGCEEIQAMESFVKMQMHVHVDGPIHKTIDCFTRPGSVRIVHESADIVEKDHARIRELETSGLFVV